MEIINEDKFGEVEDLKPNLKIIGNNNQSITDEEMEIMMRDLQNPVRAQKEMAVKVKFFLDDKIKTEMEEKGTLSDGTRRWIESYNSMLEKIQKAIHGDKSVNLNLNAISHGEIAKKIREIQNAGH